ncbi:5826_t:CDS:2 [Ambispora leptoticha]|uniref:Protein PNS1 n=1 Tax=Ambispora leptoticha TaxID=144679 RepID=A0A9N8ZCR5_9GLOM|nr:5822_t:CDS:2 [Ambispora leptoticha]CAG8490181.1 5826_t:CDS:2 [Ambispora leptoticha]
MSNQYYPPPPQQQYYPPPPQQQYYPPPVSNTYAPVPGNTYAPPSYEQAPTTNQVAEKWEPKPKYQDLWALVLYLVQFAGYVALSYVGIKDLIDSGTLNNKHNSTSISQRSINTGDSGITLDAKAIVLLVLALVLGFFLALIYMLLMQRFPKPLIKITLWLSIATYFIAAVIYGLSRQYVLALIFAVFGVIYLFAAWTWRDRIPFAAILLETVTSITKKYYGTIIMGFAGLILQVGWSIWWAFTIIGVYHKIYTRDCQKDPQTGNIRCKSPAIIVAMVFLLFSFYWTSQIIKTIVHVTDAGAYAAYYFLEGTPQGTGSAPTLSSLKRACTTSLGSICFGSLIIAALNTMKAIFRTIANSDDGACGFLACCVEYLLACIEGLVEYFNHYAYVQVAIYGKSYCTAAKDTWRLIKDRGIEAVINDNLIGNVLTMGAIFIGVLCGLFGYAYLVIVKPDFNINGQNTLFLVLICFLLGLMMTIVVTDAIDSGVTTTFVALAEDPDALRRTKPELFERIRQRWPRVVQGV